MADHEPLRVGPLVLKWESPTYAGCRLGRWTRFWVSCLHHHWSFGLEAHGTLTNGDDHHEVSDAVMDAERWLTETGYLAQYRSRRRLLARECERRAKDGHQLADSWKLNALNHRRGSDGDRRAMARHDFHRARATKYARWAKNLSEL